MLPCMPKSRSSSTGAKRLFAPVAASQPISGGDEVRDHEGDAVEGGDSSNGNRTVALGAATPRRGTGISDAADAAETTGIGHSRTGQPATCAGTAITGTARSETCAGTVGTGRRRAVEDPLAAEAGRHGAFRIDAASVRVDALVRDGAARNAVGWRLGRAVRRRKSPEVANAPKQRRLRTTSQVPIEAGTLCLSRPTPVEARVATSVRRATHSRAGNANVLRISSSRVRLAFGHIEAVGRPPIGERGAVGRASIGERDSAAASAARQHSRHRGPQEREFYDLPTWCFHVNAWGVQGLHRRSSSRRAEVLGVDDAEERDTLVMVPAPPPPPRTRIA